MTELVGIDKIIHRELITALVINCLIAAGVTWLILPHQPTMPWLQGPDSGGFGIIPASAIFPFCITILMSIGLAKKLAGTSIATKSNTSGIARWLPDNLIARGLVIAGSCLVLYSPLALAAGRLLLGKEWRYTEAFLFNWIAVVALTFLVVPPIVRKVIADLESANSRLR